MWWVEKWIEIGTEENSVTDICEIVVLIDQVERAKGDTGNIGKCFISTSKQVSWNIQAKIWDYEYRIEK